MNTPQTASCIFIFLSCVWIGAAHAADYVLNEDGAKCAYSQRTLSGERYFSSALTANTSHLVFADSTCMKDTSTNRMMIGNTVTREYGQRDAKYGTRVEELISPRGLLEKGYCIQSTNYPILAVAIDFHADAGYLTGATHSAWLNCKS